MKRMNAAERRRLALLGLLAGSATAIASFGWLTAADHIDSPLIAADQSADLADVYSFRSPTNPDHIVLAMTISNIQAAPEIGFGRSIFDPQVLYQFKIDNDGDAVEDFVIQAFVTGKDASKQKMNFLGPAAPEVTGTDARILSRSGKDKARKGKVRVSTGTVPIIKSKRGMTVFAGVRDDPFFFDFGQFVAVLGGASSFNDPGTDAFAGLNVYAIVVEFPIAWLGGDSNDLKVWATTSRP